MLFSLLGFMLAMCFFPFTHTVDQLTYFPQADGTLLSSRQPNYLMLDQTPL